MIVETEGHSDSPPSDEPETGRRLRVATRVVYYALAVVVQIAIYDLVTRVVRFGDVVAIGIPLALPVVVLALAIIAAFRKWQLLVASTTVLVALLCIVSAPRLPQLSSPPASSTAMQVMAVNFQHDSPDVSGALGMVYEIQPDILLVSELTEITNRVLSLRYDYSETFWGSNGQAVFSDIPFEKLAPTPELEALTTSFGGQLVAVRFDTPEPFVVISAHAPRPVYDFVGEGGTTSFALHRRMIEQLDAFADSQELPVVVGGDLNLSDRTHGYRVISTGRTDLARARGIAGSTYFGGRLRLLQLRIDYVLVSDDWCAGDGHHRTVPGSDHKAVMGDVGPCD